MCCSLEPRGHQRRTFRRHLPELRLFSPEVHSAMESVSHRGTVSSTWAGARLSRSGHRRILPSLTSGPLPDAQDFLLCSAILRTEEETWRFVAVQSPDTRPDQLRFARHLTGKPSQHQTDDSYLRMSERLTYLQKHGELHTGPCSARPAPAALTALGSSLQPEGWQSDDKDNPACFAQLL